MLVLDHTGIAAARMHFDIVIASLLRSHARCALLPSRYETNSEVPWVSIKDVLVFGSACLFAVVVVSIPRMFICVLQVLVRRIGAVFEFGSPFGVKVRS